MKVNELACRAHGCVSPSYVDIRTGRSLPFSPRHNTLSYMSAESMAAAFGGDSSYIPSRIGFIYGDKDYLPFSDASESSREQDWEALKQELSAADQDATVDVQIVGFSYSPSLGPGTSGGSSGSSSPEGDYNHILPGGANAVTFHAVSNSQDRGAIFDKDTFCEGRYIYQCLLLGYHDSKYYILARASLKHFDISSSGQGEGEYLTKPKGFEIALDWKVTFL